MANVRRTAMGNAVDMDMLRLANETTIAVGNMKVNARGDQLGAGGKIIKTRAQVMQEYHQLQTQFAEHDDIHEKVESTLVETPTNILQPAAEDIPVAESASVPNYTKPRGSFAGAVAGHTEVSQELLDPIPATNTPGIKRI